MTTLTITSLYAAILGLVLMPMTIRVGLRRVKTQTWFLDGGDETLLRRIRSHANFLEYVPLALLLMAFAELNNAPAAYLHGIGATLLISRLMHYATLNISPMANTRALSMLGTFAVFVMSAGWILYAHMLSL